MIHAHLHKSCIVMAILSMVSGTTLASGDTGSNTNDNNAADGQYQLLGKLLTEETNARKTAVEEITAKLDKLEKTPITINGKQINIGTTAEGPGITIGNQSVGAKDGTLIGSVSKLGQNSTVIGNVANADDNTVIVGNNTYAEDNSVVIGEYATADGGSSVAIGQGTWADPNSVAIGQGARTSGESITDKKTPRVSVGNEETQRRIVYVKKGVDKYDAVNMEQFNELKEVTETNKGSVEQLNVKMGTLRSDVYDKLLDWHTNKIEPAEKNIAKLQEDVANHTTSLKNNTGNIQQNTTDITELKKKVHDFDSATNNVKELGTKVETVESSINTINGSMATQNERIDKNEASIKELKTSNETLSAAAEKIAEVKNTVKTNSDSIESNTTAIKENKADILKNTNAVAQYEARFTENSKLVSNINSRLDALSKNTRRGLATQAALNGLFQPYNVGRVNISAALGGYKNEQAISVGTGYRFNNQFAIKAGFAVSPGDTGVYSYNIGANYEF